MLPKVWDLILIVLGAVTLTIGGTTLIVGGFSPGGVAFLTGGTLIFFLAIAILCFRALGAKDDIKDYLRTIGPIVGPIVADIFRGPSYPARSPYPPCPPSGTKRQSEPEIFAAIPFLTGQRPPQPRGPVSATNPEALQSLDGGSPTPASVPPDLGSIPSHGDAPENDDDEN